MAKPPKYAPITEYLLASAQAGRETVDLDFAQVADLVGGLPPTAYRMRQWWANDSKVEARAWRAAGWHVDTVSFDRQRVRFSRGEVGGAYAARRARE